MFKKIFSKRMLITLILGFSSGLPLLAIGSTLQAWMKEKGVDLTSIGMLSLVTFPYTVKFLWAPFFDRYALPFLGRRRGWIFVTQIFLMLSFFALSFAISNATPAIVAMMAAVTAFFSASQDIVIDAYRRELLHDEELGFGVSLAIFGYRLGILVAGAGALFLADHIAWEVVYFVLGLCCVIGMVTVFFAEEPEVKTALPKSLKEAVIEPFLDYFKRSGAFEILLFILLYKIGDVMASNMTTPFILEMGYSKTDIAAVAKTFGLIAMISGGLIGGALILKWGMKKCLVIFGFLQAISIMSFSALVGHSVDLSLLAGVVAFEYLTSGMGTAAYTGFMASITNRKFTATQYALLSSLMGIPRVIISAPTGYIAKELGWHGFFVFCTLAAIPGMLLLLRFSKWNTERSTSV